MSLAIIHLSDIHAGSYSEELSAKFSGVSAALETSDSVIDKVVILLSGDVANTGKSEEYAIAASLLKSLISRIQAIKSVSAIDVFGIPGNHDCLLTEDQEIRDLIIDGKLSNPSEALSEKKLAICLQPQYNFFKFTSDITGTPEPSIDFKAAPRLIIDSAPLKIGFLGLNSAIFTKLKEEPGKLIILNRALDTNHIPKCDILICAIHHPISWLKYECMDRLKAFTRSRVDFLFSGHEHRRELFSKTSIDGLGTVFCEAGAFHSDREKSKASFQVCLIETDKLRYKLRAFDWKQNAFRIEEDSGWQEIKHCKGSIGHRLPVSPAFRAFSNDPGAQYLHPRVGTLRLGDFLIPPSIKSIDTDDSEKASPFPLNRSGIDRITSKEGVTLIFGSERFGKTTLAKLIFNDRYDNGDSPIYVDLKNIESSSNSDRAKIIEKASKAVYAIQDPSEYFGIPQANRLLVVDNFGLAPLTLDQQRELVSAWHDHFPRIIILGNELLKIQIASGRSFTPEGANAGLYEIQELSFNGRESLIRKWCTAGELIRDEELEVERKVQRNMELVGTVLGKNLLPSTPFFILAVLQLLEADAPIQTSSSGSYGFIYEYLITQALGKASQVKDLNLKYSYLSELAYKMFVENQPTLDDAELRLFHESYLKKKQIDCDYGKLKSDLLTSQIINERDGFFSLKYRYLFYYFVARFISERFHESEFRTLSFTFIDSLHNENSFNFLVFLVYLVKDPALKTALINDAKRIFSNYSQLDFESDRKKIAELGNIIDDVKFDEEAASKAKDSVYEQLTRNSQEAPLDAKTVERELELLVQVNRAFKSIQLLGQTVKNFVGSMDGAEKINFTVTCFDLSLRTMTGMIDLLRDSAPDVALETYKQMMAESELKAAKMRVSPVIDESAVYDNARSTLYRHGQIMCLSIIKKVSLSIGSPELEPVYESLIMDRQSLSYDLLVTAIKLDHFKVLPISGLRRLSKPVADDPFFGGIVRRLALLHFYLFPTSDPMRAEICSMLQISFTGSKHLALGGKKMLAQRSLGKPDR